MGSVLIAMDRKPEGCEQQDGLYHRHTYQHIYKYLCPQF
jgi:hypothetical protein